MKKLLSSFLMIAIIASLFTTVSFASPRGMDINSKIELLQTVGVLEQDYTPELDKPVTRGEFVKLLTKLLKLEEITCDERYYVDLAEDDELWNITAQLIKSEILTVSGNRCFRPEDVITHKEAACALMKGYGAGALDYEMYTKIAISLGLFEKVSYGDMNYKDVISFLYNAFVGYPLTFAGNGMGPGDKTFMERNYDMFYKSGIVNAVDESSIDGESAILGTIRVGDLTINYTGDNLYQYLGKGVGAFYKSEDEPELVYIYTYTDNENVIEITEKNYPEFDGTTFTLTYYNENEKLKRIELPQSVNVIRNGENVTGDVTGAFEDFNTGKITILSSGGSAKYGTVIIDSYYDISVMSVNQSDGIIYGKDGTVIDVNDDSRPVSIEDVNGNKVSIDQITNNSIASVFESDEYLKIIISNAVVSGSITGIDDDENVKLTVSGTDYELYPGESLMYDLGNDVKLHLDAFGYVYEISFERKDGLKYGWIFKQKIVHVDSYERVSLDIFTEKGTFEQVILPEKIRIDGTLRKTTALQLYGLELGKSSIVDHLIMYKTNENGEAQEIDTIARNTAGGGMFREFSSATAQTLGSSSVGQQIWCSGTTFVFVIPSAANRDNREAYAVGSKELFKAWKANDVESYRSSDREKPAAAEVIVLHRDMYNDKTEQRGTYVVDDMYTIWNEQEYKVQNIVTMMNGSAKNEFILSDDFNDTDSLVAGNIVTIKLNGKKELASVTLQYGTSRSGIDKKALNGNIGAWSGDTHYIAIGKIVAMGDEYADLTISEDENEPKPGEEGYSPTLRFPISTTNIGVYERKAEKPIKVGTKGDLAEAMMRGGIVAVTMYRGTMVSIAIVK